MTTADDIAAGVAEAHGISKKVAKDIMETMTGRIAGELAMGRDVNIHGFGKFLAKNVPAHTGRNPQTGETLQIPAKRKVTFTPATLLKSALNA